MHYISEAFITLKLLNLSIDIVYLSFKMFYACIWHVYFNLFINQWYTLIKLPQRFIKKCSVLVIVAVLKKPTSNWY